MLGFWNFKSVFILLLAVFIVFLGMFGFLAWACIYHLRQYAPNGLSTPNIVTTTFALVTIALFVFAIYFFLQIPFQ